MPFETANFPFEPGDDDLADFMLDRWLPFARDVCNWVPNQAPAPGVHPNIEIWTHRGSVGVPESPFFFVHMNEKHLQHFVGSDIDLTQEIYDQPNNPANAPNALSFGVSGGGNVGTGTRCMMMNSAVGPYSAYWLFSDTTGEYIYCVLKVAARQYRHFHIGKLKQIDGGVDLDPRSFFVTSHFWTALGPEALSYPTGAGANANFSPYSNQHMVPFRNYRGTNQNGSFGTGMPNTLPACHLYMPGLYPILVNNAAVNVGGTGHVVGDKITVSLTDGVYAGEGTPAILNVDSEAAGVITGVSIDDAGDYDRAPGDGEQNGLGLPVVGILQASTTGIGIDASFDLTFEGYQFFGTTFGDGQFISGSPAQKNGDGGVTTPIGDVMIRSRIGLAQTNFYDAGMGTILYSCDPNFTANANILIPIYFSAAFNFQSDIRQGLVATAPDMFRVNMRDYAPEQEIVVGGETYVVFPMINDDSANVLAGEGYSGWEGIAYRKETDPVV